MRLDGYIAHCTSLSRKDARQAVRAGRVTVDGELARKASVTVTEGAMVALDGQPIRQPGHVYLMLNKPEGILSATTDAAQPVVTDLLPEDLAGRVHPVGRLDRDTTGLLLLTSDGQWSHRITSPRHQCPKTYRVTLAEAADDHQRRQLEAGVELRSDNAATRPARVDPVDDCIIDLTITEGRYHQVKRMVAAVGNHVVALHRHRIGNLWLDESLAAGDYRPLTDEEVRGLAEPD